MSKLNTIFFIFFFFPTKINQQIAGLCRKGWRAEYIPAAQGRCSAIVRQKMSAFAVTTVFQGRLKTWLNGKANSGRVVPSQ